MMQEFHGISIYSTSEIIDYFQAKSSSHPTHTQSNGKLSSNSKLRKDQATKSLHESLKLEEGTLSVHLNSINWFKKDKSLTLQLPVEDLFAVTLCPNSCVSPPKSVEEALQPSHFIVNDSSNDQHKTTKLILHFHLSSVFSHQQSPIPSSSDDKSSHNFQSKSMNSSSQPSNGHGKDDKPPGMKDRGDRFYYKSVLLSASGDIGNFNQIVQAIRIAAGIVKQDGSSKRFKFLLNPVGGRKLAIKLYKSKVEPLFKLAGAMIDYQETKYHLHAVEIAKSVSVLNYDAIITMSGDGLVHEILTGLLSRSDWKQAKDIPIGIIGGGTACAINKNIDTYDQQVATFSIIKGKTSPMDVLSVMQGSNVFFTHLSITWCIYADIDIESECIRWAGEARLTLWAIVRMLFLRSYHGSMYWITEKEHDEILSNIESHNPDLAPDIPNYQGPPLIHSLADYKKWANQVTDQKFQYFCACNMGWIASDVLACPHSHINDGLIDLMWSHDLNTMDILPILLETEKAPHLKNPKVKYERVKAFVLEPGKLARGFSSLFVSSLETVGFVVLSGEKVEYQPIKVEIHPSLVNIIVPYWLGLDRSKTEEIV